MSEGSFSMAMTRLADVLLTLTLVPQPDPGRVRMRSLCRMRSRIWLIGKSPNATCWACQCQLFWRAERHGTTSPSSCPTL